MTTESLLSIISKDYPCMSCPLHPTNEYDTYIPGKCPFINEGVSLQDTAFPDRLSFESVRASLCTDHRCPIVDEYYMESFPSQDDIKDLVSKTDFNYESAKKIVAAVADRMRKIDESLNPTSFDEPDFKVTIMSSALNELQLYYIINRLDFECILDAYSSDKRFIDIKHLCDENGFQYSRSEEGRINKYIETEEVQEFNNEQYEVVGYIKHPVIYDSIAMIPQYIINDNDFQNILPTIPLPNKPRKGDPKKDDPKKDEVKTILIKKDLEKLVPDFLDENLKWKKSNKNLRIMAKFTTRIGDNHGWKRLDTRYICPIAGINPDSLRHARDDSKSEDEKRKVDEILDKYFPKVSSGKSSNMKIKNFQELIGLLEQ